MSQNFAGIPVTGYIGELFSLPANLARDDVLLKNAQLARLLGTPLFGEQKRGVPIYAPIKIDWNIYGASTAAPNQGVSVDFRAGQTAGILLDQIQSLYIDNTNSLVPIYVVFPDSGQVITAQPFSAGWHPALTLNKQALIYAKGFTDGFIPQTTLFFCNFPAIPYTNLEVDQSVSLWKSSALIQRSNIFQGNYAPPALGDQTQQIILDPRTLNQQHVLFGSPLPAGFIYLTNIWCALGMSDNAGTVAFGNCVIESTGVSGNLFNFSYPVSFQGNTTIYSGNANLKLDATETWQGRVSSVPAGNFTGRIFIVLIYTINPT